MPMLEMITAGQYWYSVDKFTVSLGNLRQDRMIEAIRAIGFIGSGEYEYLCQ